MTGRRRLGLVAASATLLAAAPLSAIFESWVWLMQCILAVGLTAGAAVLTRTLRFPPWAQVLAQVVTLLFALTWMFSSGDEFLALLPSPDTFEHFGQLFTQAGEDTRNYGVPVPNREALQFIAVLGVGSCAVAVDVMTVLLRKPALAGLPMLAIYSVPVAIYVDSVPVIPFIVGAVGFLWLLVADNVDRVRRFGRRFTGDGRDVDVWEPSPLAAAGRRLAVIGVAAAILLPIVVPGLNTGLLSSLTQVGTGAGSGFGGGGNGKVNLFASLSGSLQQSETKDMIQVTTNEEEPFYLRLAVADTVTASGFANRTPNGSRITGTLPDPSQNSRPGVQYDRYHAKVKILDLNMAFAPIYATPVASDDLKGTWNYDAGSQIVYSTRTTTANKEYDFDYVRASYRPNALRQADAVRDGSLQALTTVPQDRYVDPLVERLTKSKTTQYDKVMALYNYFSKDNDFTYSLQTSSGTSGSEIADFLQNKAGYCQQYAAALAWMVREAGIPARVAFGFTRGGDRDGNTWTITNRNAHAWTEVYFDGFGWVPFDATPTSGVVGASRTDWAPDVDSPDPVTSASTAPVAPGASSSAGPAGADRPNRNFDDPGLAGGSGTTGSGISTTVLWSVALVALLIALLLVPALRRGLIRRRRHTATVKPAAPAVVSATGAADITVTTETGQARADAHAAWDELIDTMIDYRVPIDPTETPRVTAQRLIREAEFDPEPAESATLLGRAEERARYARRPLQGGELTEALGRVRKGLSRTATRRTRLVAALLPPSVMLRWRLALGDASAGTVGFFSRIRESLVRFSPRRLLTSRAR
ncbi:DUF3488 and DUF4129 domain-containing transglutaminase family protein [Actinoplanes sp. NPDC049265]|uniref:transglutaminase TgpA family protein n=1 Tax=Actinoplanes sp. NPDC049265 TaxID=3363902 RepID=UPI003721272F